MSTYRTSAEQEKLYEDDSAVANKPYASEHQTGLAADVYVRYFAGEGFLKSKAGRYVNLNCYKYGFIIRYDFGKTDSTKCSLSLGIYDMSALPTRKLCIKQPEP